MGGLDLIDCLALARPAIPIMVLIVDDHADSADLLRRVLARHNIAADVALVPTTALAVAKARRPGVIVLDEHMPDLTGLQLLRRLRADPDLRATPVLFYSVDYDAEKRSQAEQLGARGWLVKGVDRLQDVVDHVLTCLPPPPPPA